MRRYGSISTERPTAYMSDPGAPCLAFETPDSIPQLKRSAEEFAVGAEAGETQSVSVGLAVDQQKVGLDVALAIA